MSTTDDYDEFYIRMRSCFIDNEKAFCQIVSKEKYYSSFCTCFLDLSWRFGITTDSFESLCHYMIETFKEQTDIKLKENDS